MKHTDFLNSLKNLKSHLLKNKKTTSTPLASVYNHREKSFCTCTDAQGEHKHLYNTEKELTYLLSKKDIQLHAYPCPYEKGWHLSKI